METTLVNKYPTFSAGQLLNHEQLNTLFQFLAGQDRNTRKCLIGAGIFYGLKIEPQKELIRISKGTGTTSDGKLVCQKDIELKYFQKGLSLKKNIFCSKVADDSEITDVYELFEEVNDQITYEDVSKIRFGKPHALVIYIEEKLPSKDSSDRCIQSFDPEISYTTIKIRYFLIDKEQVKDCFENHDSSEFNSKGLPLPCIPRFGTNFKSTNSQLKAEEPSIYLNEIKSLKDFVKNYKDVCNAGVSGIKKYSISGMYNVLSDKNVQSFLENLLKMADINDIPFAERVENWKKFIDDLISTKFQTSNKEYLEQYIYDYLEDFILAYEELMDHTFINFLQAYPCEKYFPNHLTLGCLVRLGVENFELSLDYRTPLFKLPFDDHFNERLDEALCLIKRLRKFLNPRVPDFRQLPSIKIIPSKGKNFPLSQRSIPFYYKLGSTKPEELGLLHHWSYDKKRKGREELIPTYSSIEVDNGTRQPLIFDLERFEFFRIEGHVGKELEEVKRDVLYERDRLNLPFDLICLRLGKTFDSQGDFSTNQYLDLERDYEESKMDLCFNVERLDISDKLKEELHSTLPISISEFNYDSFKISYEKVKEAAKGQWPYPKNCEEEAILDRLKTEYNKRIKNHLDEQAFHNFAKRHTGMEHLAGVSKGGTFIIVYIEESVGGGDDDVEIVKKTVVADFSLPYLCCAKGGYGKISLDEIIKPKANFTWTKKDIYERKEPYNLCEITRHEYTFNNLSQNGQFYAWSINNQQDTVHFEEQNYIKEIDLEKLNSNNFEAELLAIRGDFRDKKEEIINVCPSKVEVVFEMITEDGNRQVITIEEPSDGSKLRFINISKSGENDLLFIKTKPFGGKMLLEPIGQDDSLEGLSFKTGTGSCKPEKEYALDFSKSGLSEFRLNYGFPHCGLVESFKVNIENVILDFELIKEELVYQKNDAGNNTCTIIGVRAEFKNKSYQIEPTKDLEVFNWYVKPLDGPDDSEKMVLNTIDVKMNLIHEFIFEPFNPKYPKMPYQVRLQGVRKEPSFDQSISKPFEFCINNPGEFKLQHEIFYGENEIELKDLKIDSGVVTIEINRQFRNKLILEANPDGGGLFISNEDGSNENQIQFIKSSDEEKNCVAEIELNQMVLDTKYPIRYYLPCIETGFDLVLKEAIIISATDTTIEENELGNLETNIFDERRLNYNYNLGSLASSDQELVTRKAYTSTQGFLDVSPSQANLSKSYQETASLVITATKRAKEDKKEAYHKVFETLTHSFLDKAVMLDANKIIPEVKTELEKAISKAKEAGIDIGKLKRNWKGAEIKKAYPSKSVGEYQKLMK